MRRRVSKIGKRRKFDGKWYYIHAPGVTTKKRAQNIAENLREFGRGTARVIKVKGGYVTYYRNKKMGTRGLAEHHRRTMATYWCSKCGRRHRTSSRIGRYHRYK